MSRSTQFIGLSNRAATWLKEHAEVDWIGDPCPHCGKQTQQGYMTEPIENKLGMFGESEPIYKYQLKDGTCAYEADQITPWSSGPVIFTALKDENGEWIKDTLWHGVDINEVQQGLVENKDEPIITD